MSFQMHEAAADRFESLGDNCEFGLVMRRLGFEHGESNCEPCVRAHAARVGGRQAGERRTSALQAGKRREQLARQAVKRRKRTIQAG